MIHAAMMMYYGIYSQGGADGPVNLLAYPYYTETSSWDHASDGSQLSFNQPDMDGGNNATLITLVGANNHHVWYELPAPLQNGVPYMLTVELKAGLDGYTNPFDMEYRIGDTVVAATEVNLSSAWERKAFGFIPNTEGLSGIHSIRLLGWGNGVEGDQVVMGKVVLSEIPEPTSYPEVFQHTTLFDGSKWESVDTGSTLEYGVADSHGHQLATRLTLHGPENHHLYQDLGTALDPYKPYTLTVRWKQGDTGFAGLAELSYRDGDNELWKEEVPVPATWETQTFDLIPNGEATAPSLRLVGWGNGTDGESIDFEFVHLTQGLEAPVTPLVVMEEPRPFDDTNGWNDTGIVGADGTTEATTSGEFLEFVLDNNEYVRYTLSEPLPIGVDYTVSLALSGSTYDIGYYDGDTPLVVESFNQGTSQIVQQNVAINVTETADDPNIRILHTGVDGITYRFSNSAVLKGGRAIQFLWADINNLMPAPYIAQGTNWYTVSDGSQLVYDQPDEKGGTDGALVKITGPDNHHVWYNLPEALVAGRGYALRVFAQKGQAGYTGDFQLAYYSGTSVQNERDLPVPDEWGEMEFAFIAGEDTNNSPTIRLVGWDGGLDGEEVHIGKIVLESIPEPDVTNNPELLGQNASDWENTSGTTMTNTTDSQGGTTATRVTMVGSISHHLDQTLTEPLEDGVPYTLSVKMKQGTNGFAGKFQMAYYDNDTEVLGQEVDVPATWEVVSYSFIPWAISGPAVIRLIGYDNGVDGEQVDIESVHLIKGTTPAAH